MSGWDESEEWGDGFSNITPSANVNTNESFDHHVPNNIKFGRGQKQPFAFREQENSGYINNDPGDEKIIMVDCKMCGRIIGKGGAKIRELQESSGAKIQVDRNEQEGDKVPVKISGNDLEKEEAERLIKSLLEEQKGNSSSFQSDRSRFGNERKNDNFSNTNSGKTIFIKATQCGRVIGRGGSKIHELQDDSGARINVKSNESDGDTVPVVLTGGQAAIDKAEELILDLLSEDSYGSSKSTHNDMKSDRGAGKGDGFTSSGFIDWNNVNLMCRIQTKKRWENSPPIRKNFYIEDESVADMLPHEVAQWREDNFNISVTHLAKEQTNRILNPVLTFEQAFNCYPEVLKTIYDQGFVKPSPVQCQAWPLAMSGFDVIGIAQTGTGKTLAFLLPAFLHIDGQPIPRSERGGPSCLILTPTRELALQIEMEIKKYHYRDIRCVCVYGGGDRRKQINLVTQGVEIIVATPGRFNDLLANEYVSLDSVTFLVLDEADRMLDMGFEPQIMKILLDIRPDRQTMMTSATWPEGVRRLARSYLTDPMQVAVGSLDLAATHTVKQIVEIVAEEEKRDRLLDHIANMEPSDKVLVFVGRKTTADNLSADLIMMNIICQSIHGGREQYDREQALNDFKSGEVNILVATDVASRGLDVADISHVFNYDYPRNTEEYVHRVGRTGRAGRSGTSITLVTREDWSTARELIDILVEAQQDVPIELYDMAERFAKMKERREREGGFRRGGGRGRGGGFGGRRGRGNSRW
ncbi:putative ATP-dependent RNA helicase DDX43 [Styela clava]